MWKKVFKNPIPYIVLLAVLCLGALFLVNSPPAAASDDDVVSGEVRVTEQHPETFEEFVEDHEVDTDKPPLVGRTDDGGMFVIYWEKTKHTASEALDLAGQKLSQFIKVYEEKMAIQNLPDCGATSTTPAVSVIDTGCLRAEYSEGCTCYEDWIADYNAEEAEKGSVAGNGQAPLKKEEEKI